ncbi:ribosome-associated translation inhibitor RaiA [Candidatus Peregrinibacteria bacterium]|nr:ribosome-associated translation inhibitor RaiA [Candidatus Peregrinibacteria bacterium]
MKVEIFRENLELGLAEETFIREKIEHLAKYCHKVDDEASFVRVDVVKNKVKTTDKKFVIEITMHVPHATIRAEESGVSIEEALRNVCEKLEKQVEKYKSSEERRYKSGDLPQSSTLENIYEKQDEYKEKSVVSKRKKLGKLELMTEEEAICQMELLGHDFFVYKNSADEKVHVVYKREDESYGVIDVDEGL